MELNTLKPKVETSKVEMMPTSIDEDVKKALLKLLTKWSEVKKNKFFFK